MEDERGKTNQEVSTVRPKLCARGSTVRYGLSLAPLDLGVSAMMYPMLKVDEVEKTYFVWIRAGDSRGEVIN